MEKVLPPAPCVFTQLDTLIIAATSCELAPSIMDLNEL